MIKLALAHLILNLPTLICFITAGLLVLGDKSGVWAGVFIFLGIACAREWGKK